MVDWIAKDLGVTTLRYQTVEDMVKAIDYPRQKLCLYCWTGECPKAVCPGQAVKIVETRKPARGKKPAVESVDQSTLW
jgi:glutamine phosphoribosylpyrophosphate amidotransferase